jgi:16S rRNA (cytosine967-C5)-methyltransferase
MMTFQEHHLFQILRRYDNQHLPLDLFLSQYYKSNTALGANDRRVISESVYGITRFRILLDYLSGDDRALEKQVAIFKGFQPTQYLYVNTIPLHIRVSFPKVLFDLLVSQYGEKEAVALCTINNTQAPTTIRVNALKTSREKLFASWNGKYEIELCEKSPHGILFKKRVPFFEMPEFKEGCFEVQDEASQLVALKMKVKPGDQVLDYCAGSGGKTLAFAPLMENKGQIYLHDVRNLALDQARKRLLRAGIQNAQLLQSQHPLLEKIKKKLDWVLVDAPCTGTGTHRRNPDMKIKFNLEMLNRLVSEQRVIFEKALSFCKPGGHIVYATCSLLKAENEDQIKHFLKTYPVELVEEPFVSLPTLGGMDGFFAATLRKK